MHLPQRPGLVRLGALLAAFIFALSANAAAQAPVEVQHDPTQPYQVTVGTAGLDQFALANFDVPAGFRLVVESLALSVTLPNAQRFEAKIQGQFGDGEPTIVELDLNPTIDNSTLQQRFVATKPMRLYFDDTGSAEDITVVANRGSFSAGIMVLRATLVGYLVPFPRAGR